MKKISSVLLFVFTFYGWNLKSKLCKLETFRLDYYFMAVDRNIKLKSLFCAYNFGIVFSINAVQQIKNLYSHYWAM